MSDWWSGGHGFHPHVFTVGIKLLFYLTELIKNNLYSSGGQPRWLSDACPTGGQEVMGSIPTGSVNILSWRLIMKYFLGSIWGHSLPLADSRWAVVRFWQKDCVQVLVNGLEDYACSGKKCD